MRYLSRIINSGFFKKDLMDPKFGSNIGFRDLDTKQIKYFINQLKSFLNKPVSLYVVKKMISI